MERSPRKPCPTTWHLSSDLPPPGASWRTERPDRLRIHQAAAPPSLRGHKHISTKDLGQEGGPLLQSEWNMGEEARWLASTGPDSSTWPFLMANVTQ